MKSQTNPFGKVTNALFSAGKIDNRISFYNSNGIDSVLFKIYRSVASPDKALIGQFTGGKNSISGAKSLGEVFDKPIAAVSLKNALSLYGVSADEILKTAETFNDINELKDLLGIKPGPQ